MKDKTSKNKATTCEFNVEGMNCASCELNIENSLKSKFKNIEDIDAKLSTGKVMMTFKGEIPSLNEMNEALEDTHYKLKKLPTIRNQSFKFEKGRLVLNFKRIKNQLVICAIAIGVIFLLSGLYDLIINSFTGMKDTSTLIGKEVKISTLTISAFFVSGLLAGFSGCAALVGGLLISLRNQLNSFSSDKKVSLFKKLSPYIQFNLGRLLSFFLLGGVLGVLGSVITINTSFSSLLVIVVAVAMIALGAQMAGWSYFQRFKIALPKGILRKISNTDDLAKRPHRLFPFILGFMTFFLPCGVTLLSQSIAITTGDFLTSAVLMGVFALGTLPPLLLISFFNIYSGKSKSITDLIIKVSGVVVVFFAIYTLNSTLKIFGIPTLDTIRSIAVLFEFMIFYLLLLIIGVNIFGLIKMGSRYKDERSKIYNLGALLLISLTVILIYNYPVIRNLIF